MMMQQQQQPQRRVVKANAGTSIRKPQSKSFDRVLVQQPQALQSQLQQQLCRSRQSFAPKSVRFSTKEDVKEVTSVKNLSEDTKRSIWYTPDDCQRMVEECMPTVSLMTMIRSLPESLPGSISMMNIDTETSHSTTRGLEDMTSEGSERRRLRIHKTIEAVLDEQLNQWEAFEYNPERLAMVSTASSSLSQMDARLTARIDEVTMDR